MCDSQFYICIWHRTSCCSEEVENSEACMKTTDSDMMLIMTLMTEIGL